eukprot:SAG11_NODE_8173_length_1052_cov_1.050367_1_plen_157_part_10
MSRFGHGCSVPAIAQFAGYSGKSVRRWIREYIATDTTDKLPRKLMHKFKLSTAAIRALILIMTDDPALFYDEVQLMVWARTSETVSVSTIQRTAQRLGFDDKVAETRSRRRDPVLMGLHAQNREMYHYKQLLFVDEVHKRGRDLRRKRAKGRHGKPA